MADCVLLVILLEGILAGFGLLKFDEVSAYRPQYPFASQAVDDAHRIERLFRSAPSYQSQIRPELELNVIFKPTIHSSTPFSSTVLDGYCLNYNLYLGSCWANFYHSNLHIHASFPFRDFSPYTYYGDMVSRPKEVHGSLVSAAALKMAAPISMYTHAIAPIVECVDALENRLKDASVCIGYGNDSDMAFSHSLSLNQEMHVAVLEDQYLFYGSFCVTVAVVCAIVAPSGNRVTQRLILVLAAVVSQAMCVIATLGIYSVSGLQFTSIQMVSPIFCFGLALVGLHVMLESLVEQETDNVIDVEGRVAVAFQESVTVIIIFLTSALTFAIAALTTVLSDFRMFCTFSAILIALNLVNHLTFIPACAVLNERRIEIRWHWLTCGQVQPMKEDVSSVTPGNRVSRSAATSDAVKYLPERVIRKLEDRITPHLWVFKGVVCVLFFGLFSASAYGCSICTIGWNPDDVVSESSYLYTYNQWNKDFAYPRPVIFVIHRPVDYSDKTTRDNIEHMLSRARDSLYISKEFVSKSWLDEYVNSTFFNVSNINGFLRSTTYSRYDFDNDVVVSSWNSISASRFYVFPKLLQAENDKCSLMRDMRDIANESELPVIAYSPSFLFYEECTVLPNELITFIGIHLLLSVGLWLVLFWFPIHIVVVTLLTATTFTCIVGTLTFWNMTLNSITLSYLCIAWCFAVLLAFHAGFALTKDGGASGLPTASIRMLTAVVKASFGLLIGGAVLMAGSAFIYRMAYKILFVALVLGLVHALLLLPIVISMIGPSKFHKFNKVEDVKETKHIQY